MSVDTVLRAVPRGLVLLAIAVLTGCANVKLEATSPSPQTQERLRINHGQPMRAGQFVLAPERPAEMDTSLGGLRGSSLAPAKGSFAQLLKDTFVVEMTSAGLYDPTSPLVVESELTDSQVDAAIGTGSGRLAARFKVLRGSQSLYDKELVVVSTWESSFMGAVAIPTAMTQYHAMYTTLIRQLVEDDAFRKAVAR